MHFLPKVPGVNGLSLLQNKSMKLVNISLFSFFSFTLGLSVLSVSNSINTETTGIFNCHEKYFSCHKLQKKIFVNCPLLLINFSYWTQCVTWSRHVAPSCLLGQPVFEKSWVRILSGNQICLSHPCVTLISFTFYI